MNLLKCFKKLLTPRYNGAPQIGDTSEFVRFQDLLASGASFQERTPVGYTVRNQNGSGSCVAQTVAKMLEIEDFKLDGVGSIYSATPIYKSRSNKPQAGMIGTEALDHPIINGGYLESEVNSQNMDDNVMDFTDYYKAVVVKDKPLEKVLVKVGFYDVASAVNLRGACMVWFKCGYNEWSQDIPTGLSDSEAVRHSVAAVDTISYKGVEYIIIEDSWGKWLKQSDLPLKEGQRAITKEFFDKHCYFAACYTKWTYNNSSPTSFQFTYTMKRGSSAPDVLKLQEKLQQLGYFPSNKKCTGFYGPTTSQSVLAWQLKYNVDTIKNLTALKGETFGPRSIKKINSLA